jgi:hypothetical protein
MFPIATMMNGMSKAFPDVCKTPAPPAPPIPVPYPNMAMFMQANPTSVSKKVKVIFMPVLVLTSEIPMTAGDEPGSAGGVMSGTIKGPTKFTRGSAKVMIEGKPVIYHTCTTGQNGSAANAPLGIHDTPSQAKVTVLM